MSGEPRAQQRALWLAKYSTMRFKYESIEELCLLNYERPTKGEGESHAVHFFGGQNDTPETSATAAEKSSSVEGAAGSDEEGDSDTSGESETSSDHSGDGSGEGEDDQVLRRDDGLPQSQLVECLERLAKCEEKLSQSKLESAKLTNELSMVHNQVMHSAQELGKAQRALVFAQQETDVRIQTGSYPFLVHRTSVPLVWKRIEFAEAFRYKPKVVVGAQTGAKSAMMLVFASEVNTEGFTLHVDLANHGHLKEESTDLLKGLVTYIAVEDARGRVWRNPDEERALKRARQ